MTTQGRGIFGWSDHLRDAVGRVSRAGGRRRMAPMNGGLASPAARRSEVSESASRSRREPAARAPAPELMAPRMNGEPGPVPGTRERMQASFGAAELAPVLPIVPPAVEALTTRDRIVNRALAVPEAAPPAIEPAAVVVDIAPARERRRERQPEVPAAPPGPPAPVIPLTPRPEAARAPPAQVGGSPPGAGPARGDVAASAAPARAPPEAKPEEIAVAPSPEPGATPEPEAAPEGAGPETGPTDGAAPSAEAAEPAAAPEGAEAAPSAVPEAATEGVPALPKGAAAPQPVPAVAAVAAPVAEPVTSRNPEDEPGFRAMKERTNRAAVRTKRHQSGKKGAATAQGASQPDRQKDIDSDRPGRLPAGVGAADALPKPVPPWWTDLSAGPLQVEAKMAEGNLTEEQLTEANEPEFSAVLTARDEVREHAATDPADYRTQEELVLARGRAEAEGVAGAELEGMHASRTGTLDAVLGVKGDTKVADAQLHDDVHQGILGIHEQTQADVKTLLNTLDSVVDTIFTSGEKAAGKNFEDYVAEEMRKYKDDRYSGWFGWARWVKDR